MGPFQFASRPSGRVLLGALGVTWVLEFLVLAYVILSKQDFEGMLDAVGAQSPVLALAISLAYVTAYAISVIAFLLWIFRVHQDLGVLSPPYPISPGGAVAHVSVPIYNFYGLWKVFHTMGEEFLSELSILPRLLSLGFFLVARYLLRTRVASAWFDQLLILSLISVWIITTRMIHRALAKRAERKTTSPGFGGLTERASMVSEGSADARKVGPSLTPNDRALYAQAKLHPTPAASSKGSPGGRRLRIVLAVVGLAACGLCAAVTAYMPTALQAITVFLEDMSALEEEWYDESFDQLWAVLSERWDPDDSIPNAAVNFSFRSDSEGPSATWLVIDLETTTPCTLHAGDPCTTLAYEFAGIVLENYSRVNELAGLQVVVTHVSGVGPIDVTKSVDASWSIPEWRQKLTSPTSQRPAAGHVRTNHVQ